MSEAGQGLPMLADARCYSAGRRTRHSCGLTVFARSKNWYEGNRQADPLVNALTFKAGLRTPRIADPESDFAQEKEFSVAPPHTGTTSASLASGWRILASSGSRQTGAGIAWHDAQRSCRLLGLHTFLYFGRADS